MSNTRSTINENNIIGLSDKKIVNFPLNTENIYKNLSKNKMSRSQTNIIENNNSEHKIYK